MPRGSTYYARHKERIKAEVKRSYWKNRTKRLAKNQQWFQDNKAWRRAYEVQRYKDPELYARKLRQNREYRERNKAKIAAAAKARRKKYPAAEKVSRVLRIPFKEACRELGYT